MEEYRELSLVDYFLSDRTVEPKLSEAQVGRLKVVTHDEVASEKIDYRQEKALQFLQDHFYGSQVNRVPGTATGYFLWKCQVRFRMVYIYL